MIKLRKGNLIVLGLSDENMKRLNRKTGDQPIKFNLKDLGMDDIDVIIMNGETEQQMYMQARVFIGPDTDIKGTPFDKSN